MGRIILTDMSMIGCLRRLGDADVARLLAEPALIHHYLDPDAEQSEGFGPFVDLEVEKAWHGIQFLLTGTAWAGELPLSFLVSGGVEVGDEDVGYGPARALTSEQVRAIARALARIDEQELRARFDPGAMMKADVYPRIWDRRPEEDDSLGYLVAHYEALREFIAGAAEAGEAMLVYVI